jgi:hypothetical protein
MKYWINIAFLFLVFGSCSKYTTVSEREVNEFSPVIESFISQNIELNTKSGNLFRNKIVMDSSIISKRYSELKIPDDQAIETNFHPIIRPYIAKLRLNQSFKIALLLSIDKNGNVAYIDFLHTDTNLIDRSELKHVMDYVGNFKFPPFTQDTNFKFVKYNLIVNKERN